MSEKVYQQPIHIRNSAHPDFYIPLVYDATIGIAMSGGMDSTVLADILFSRVGVDYTKYTVYTVDLKSSVNTVKAILDYLEVAPKHVILPDPKNVNGALSNTFLEVCKEVDYFYTAITKNPPWADSIPDGQKPHRFNKVRYQNMFMPFGMTDKSDIVRLANQIHSMELVKMTHTCTERAHGSKSCGTCFACRERIWAFQEAGVEDTVEYEQID